MPGKFPALLILLFLGAAIPLTGQSSAFGKAERINQVVSRYQNLGYFNGAILVADRGKIICSKGAGKASFDHDIPNTPRTEFGIASITKQFTALLVLQQAADGKILLQGRVSDSPLVPPRLR